MAKSSWNQYASFLEDDTKKACKDTVYEVAVVMALIMVAKWVQGEPPPTVSSIVCFFPLLISIIFLLHGLGLDACGTVQGVVKGQLFNRLFTLVT